MQNTEGAEIMVYIQGKLALISAAFTATVICSAISAEPAANRTEEKFMAENKAAMDMMMADMNVDPSGDIDRDFVAMMTPHHMGAVDMAQSELRYGKNEQLRRIAQEIIVEQQQEIAAMRVALGDPRPPSSAARGQTSSLPSPAMQSGTMSMTRHN
jgi:hypothetical protein